MRMSTSICVIIILQAISDARHTQCFCYFQKTGSLSHNFSVVKTCKICNPPEFKFYVNKSTDKKNSPYGVILILRLFSLLVLY